jgi:murein L,D-transpeptidase YcbB/YkuD
LLADTIRWLKHAYGVYHWIDHWGFSQYIFVDVATAEVQFIEEERVLLSMRAVVGKPSTPTPFFAAWAERIVLYPYWFVPSSIAIGEFLPKIKNDPSWLDRQNMQVVDGEGNIVDSKNLNWAQFNASFFPFTIRQSTGCDNALGVLKVDVKTPLGVYLHDTNNKASFLLSKRFFSHGCIRLEEPMLLGNYLLKKQLDTLYLQSCLKEQQPAYLPLMAPMPVLVFYTLAHPQPGGGVRYYPDTYKLFQKK